MDNKKSLLAVLFLLSILSGINLVIAAQLTSNWFFESNISTNNLVFSFHIIFDLSPACLFFAPLLGFFSDIYQRKAILVIIAIVNLVGFIINYFATQWHIANLYLFSILILGIIRCSIPLLLATVMANYAGIKRYQWLGLIAFPIMFFDPPDAALQQMITNTISRPTLMSIAIFSSLIMIFAIKRWYPKNITSPLTLEKYVDDFIIAVKQKEFLLLLLMIIVFIFSWGIFDQKFITSIYALQFSSHKINFFIALKYASTILGFILYLVFIRYFWKKVFLYIGLIILSIGLFLLSMLNSTQVPALFIINSICFPPLFLSFIYQIAKRFEIQKGLILTLVLDTMASIIWSFSAGIAYNSNDSIFMFAGILLLVGTASCLYALRKRTYLNP